MHYSKVRYSDTEVGQHAKCWKLWHSHQTLTITQTQNQMCLFTRVNKWSNEYIINKEINKMLTKSYSYTQMRFNDNVSTDTLWSILQERNKYCWQIAQMGLQWSVKAQVCNENSVECLYESDSEEKNLHYNTRNHSWCASWVINSSINQWPVHVHVSKYLTQKWLRHGSYVQCQCDSDSKLAIIFIDSLCAHSPTKKSFHPQSYSFIDLGENYTLASILIK